MLIEILACTLAGVTLGSFSGLSPGIHLNLVALLTLSASPFLLHFLPPAALGAFIVAMAITHTYLDTLPAIYLGAPDDDKALGVLPGHRMLLRGEGHAAVVLTLMGSHLSFLLSLVLFPAFIYLMVKVQQPIEQIIGYLLILVALFLIVREKGGRRFLSLSFFLLAGCLGIVVLNIPSLSQPLFPLLSGLFGLSTLLLSLGQPRIPKQKAAKSVKVDPATETKGVGAATGVGFLAAFLPGFGSSQAAIAAQEVTGDLGDGGFLILVGGINTANMLISLAAAYALDKARNGAIVVLKELIDIDIHSLLIFLAAALIASGLALLLCLWLSRLFVKAMEKVNYTKLVLGVIGLIVLLSIIFDGPLGFFVLLVCTSLGVAATVLGVAKNHLMACLLVPVICFFML